jgi:bifunctional non-homologous end joining protein LigD
LPAIGEHWVVGLGDYAAKRDFSRTTEPPPGTARPWDGPPRFVVQEHHARRLHWDLRLERDGVGVSWALPKGIPLDPRTNHLAVPTEDHPLEYFRFEGEIPAGSYGAGTVRIWDEGTYECEKWTDREVKVVLHGRRIRGRYALFRTGERSWMIHRMDPPADPERRPMPPPGSIEPMKATPAAEPPTGSDWAFEIKWDGHRVLAFVSGGRVRLQSRNRLDATGRFPELRGLGPALGSREVILDGEVVAFDESGRPSFSALQERARRRSRVVYEVFDLLWLDGRSTMGLPYLERRRLLGELGLAGPAWQVPAHHVGDGPALLAASREQDLEGLVAKRVDSVYEPGRRSPAWRKIKNVRRQEFVVLGWVPGDGGRSGRIGSLLVGYHEGVGGPLRYAGRVGTGFTEAELARLERLLAPLVRAEPPVADPWVLPTEVRRSARWVEPEVVCEVAFSEWTHGGVLRAASYKGLRDDKPAAEVVREEPAI